MGVVVDAVVCHWESLMAEGSGRDDRSGNKVAQTARQTIRVRNDGRRWTEEGLKVKDEILYAECGMVASTDPGWIQTVFDTLTGIFERVGLKINVQKNVGMVCHPFRASGVRAEKSYIRGMMGAGRGAGQLP